MNQIEKLTEDQLYCDAEDLHKIDDDVSNLKLNNHENEFYGNSDNGEFYEDDDYDDYYMDDGGPSVIGPHSNVQNNSNKLQNYQPSDNLFKKYTNKINVDKYEVKNLPNHATNVLIENEKRQDNSRIKTKDKHDRATAEQYNQAFRPAVLKNWEVPSSIVPKKPKNREGYTKIISNSRGHLLPEIKRSQKNPFGEYIGTWQLPKKINRDTANQLNGLYKINSKTNFINKHRQARIENILNDAETKNICSNEPDFLDKKKPDFEPTIHEASDKALPYVPGDLTETKHRLDSHEELDLNRFGGVDAEAEKCKGFLSTREDFSKVEDEPKILDLELKRYIENYNEMKKNQVSPELEHRKSKKACNSPILAAISNFSLAKKLHRENLEHEPLPDTVAHKVYQRLQMQKDKAPGLGISEEEAENFATGVGWKGYPGYGPNRCTKLKVFRPKTCMHNKIINMHENRPSSVSSFDKKWRFIRQSKVSPIDLAICWDLSPENPKDEPKPTTHIDGSNGSSAPAVFSLVHTPKENAPKGFPEPKCDGIHVCGPIFEHAPKMGKNERQFILDRPKTSIKNLIQGALKKDKKLQRQRSKSAVDVNDENDAQKVENHEHTCQHSNNSSRNSTSSSHSLKNRQNMIKSVPNNLNNLDAYYACKQCAKEIKSIVKNRPTCLACELKNVKLTEEKSNKYRTQKKNIPEDKFKLGFKAGVPQNKNKVSMVRVKVISVPKQKDPYRIRNYRINSLVPPFSLQNLKREDYPEHWRLATVYQHSYKPLQYRKRPLLATIFK